MDTLSNVQSIRYFFPELILVLFAAGVIIFDLIGRQEGGRRAAHLSLVGLAVTLVAVLIVGAADRSLFLGMVQLDSFAVFFKVIILITTAVTILFSMGFRRARSANKRRILRAPSGSHTGHVPHGVINASAHDLSLD